MRILIAHNFYQQSGGEDTVYAAEVELLKKHGHTIIEYTDTNTRIQEMSPIAVALQTIWSQPSYNKISRILQKEKPDVVHFHNTFPLISPSAYYACRKERIPVIQTLHNYRILCPVSTFARNSKICEECLGKKFAFPGICYACYHSSRKQTAVISIMISFHKVLGTWKNLVDSYIVMTNFSQHKFVEGGLPPTKIRVKPHFIAHNLDSRSTKGDFALFVGRLSSEKGVLTLLKAWQALSLPVPLKIIGDGLLRNEVIKTIENNSQKRIEYLGAVQHNQVLSLIKDAFFLVFPSECYETFGMVAIECFAQGVPVVGSNIGVLPEIIKNGETGLLFNPGDPTDLRSKVEWLWNHPEESAHMGRNARKEYEEKYTPEHNYKMLMEIYSSAIIRRSKDDSLNKE